MTKYIFITGGVVSSLGKGLTAASIGKLLEWRGLKVGMQKVDPYLNIDPGTMSPYQHGEVYVLPDGTETDLDLGHYHRFTNAELNKDSAFTAGQVYNSVLRAERKGDYLGKTVQVVPHITDEIKRRIKSAAKDNDVLICEIGGTVGDIEGLPFIEAIRQMRYDLGKENTMFIHLTLIPYLAAAQELKTKPTQHSVQKLREIGIKPDVLICRSEKPIEQSIIDKISLFCDVEKECVIIEEDVRDTIYEIPLVLSDQCLDTIIDTKLNLNSKMNSESERAWRDIVAGIIYNPGCLQVNIAVVGKYVELQDAYKSIYEALVHGAAANNVNLNIIKISSDKFTKVDPSQLLDCVDGILIPGGYGDRGIEGKILAAQFARENDIPLFGICLGMQVAIVEIARNICGLEKATSREIDPDSEWCVVDYVSGQDKDMSKGGTMRLGNKTMEVIAGTKAECIYKNLDLKYQTYFEPMGMDELPIVKRENIQVEERHRHRFAFNLNMSDYFADTYLTISGVSKVVEIMEYMYHPWYILVQFHPEYKSKPGEPHPLFKSFINTALEEKIKKRRNF